MHRALMSTTYPLTSQLSTEDSSSQAASTAPLYINRMEQATQMHTSPGDGSARTEGTRQTEMNSPEARCINITL